MFGQMADRWFLELLNAGFAASAAVLVVLLLRLPLRRAPKLYSYLLWAPVLFRLLCPFPIESVFSLLPARAQPIPQDILTARTPRIETGVAVLDRTVNAALPAGEAAASVNPLQVWLWAAQIVWLAGAAGLLLYSVIAAQRLRRRLRGAVREEKNIYSAAGLETPFVMGLFRPRIYLPAGLADAERRYILLHEQTHIRRGDHLWRLLGFLALCLHWYNPLVWLAFSMSGRDMEMSCDEAVLRVLGDDVKKPYSASLLALASGRRWVGGTPLAFGEGDTGARIKNVLRYRRPAFWVSLALLAAVAAAAVGLALSPRSGREGEGASSSPPAQVSSSGAQAQPVSLEKREQAFLKALFASVSADGGVARFTVPSEIPAARRLDIEVYAQIPRSENGVPYTEPVEGFQTQTEQAEPWEAGRTYSETLIEGEIPDGSYIGFSAWFVDEDGVSETYGHVGFSFEGGTTVKEIDPGATRVRGEETAGRGDGKLVTLEYIESDGGSFSVSLELPASWMLTYAGEPRIDAYAAMDLYAPDGVTCLGTVGYDLFQMPDWEAEDLHVPIYSHLMLGSVVSWDNDYTEVKREGTAVAATCRVSYQEGGAGGSTSYKLGVLARDEALGRYIALQLEPDAVTGEELEAIARSVRFNP